MLRGLLILAVFITTALPAWAQEPLLQPTKLTLKAAAAPVPALKYLLLPGVQDLQPGNALVCYLRANTGRFTSAHLTSKQWEEMDALRELPFDEFKVAKKPDFGLGQSFDELDRAARREFCDWEMLSRIRKDGYQTPIADAQQMRQSASFLAYRARLDLAKGDFEKTAFTIQTMMGMSRHLADAPTLIHQLVGIAVGVMALYQVEEFIQQPDAPNLYWALTALPRPFIEIRKGMEAEGLMIESHFSELKKMDKEALSPEEIKSLVNKCCFVSFSSPSRQNDADLRSKLQLVGQVIQYYPAARKALIDQGRKAEEVDALPMLQVVIMHNYQICQQVRDDMIKWTYVPLWQGQPRLEEVQGELHNKPFFPFHLFLPAIMRVNEACVRLDRRIAALRCVEALRLHVAQTGKVPGSLDEITLVPIPLDPYTGKPFQYTATEGVIKLYGPPLPGRPVNEGTVVNYQITIKR